MTRIRLPPTPRRVAFRCLGGLAVASVCCLAGCNASDRPTAPSGSLLVTALTVNGPASILVGQSARFTATARLGNGATQDVTTSAAWYSSSPQVATVSGAGLVSASGLGTTAIAASYGMVSATVAVSVVGPGGRLTGRVVNALAPEAGLQDAIVDVDGVGWTISDSNGYFTLASTEQRKYAVRVTSPSWVDRQTWMKVPGAHLDVSLIPGSFDLQFFNQMCRGFGGRLLRWTQVPVLVVETSVLEYAGKRATEEQVPVPLLDQTVEKLRRALSDQSAGRFPDFWSVERRTTPGGGTSGIPHGAIALTWQRGLVAGFGHVAYGSRSTLEVRLTWWSARSRWTPTGTFITCPRVRGPTTTSS